MSHLTEEEHVLACYSEPLPLEERVHLSTCSECRAAVTHLKRLLEMADQDFSPEPEASFEDRVWATLQWQLPSRRSSMKSWWLPAAAAVAFLLIGFGAGQFLRRGNDGRVSVTARHHQPALPSVKPEDGRVAALHSAGREQLDRSSRLLIDVSNQSTDDADFSAVRAKAEELVSDNRLLRAASKKGRRDEVSELLDDIEPILVELAHSSSDMSPEELAAIQHRIESHKLLFKLRVVSSTLREAHDKQIERSMPAGGATL